MSERLLDDTTTAKGLTDDTVPREKYDSLARKFDVLRKEYEECLSQLGKAKVKLSDAKRAIKSWQAYIDRHPKYVDNGDAVIPPPPAALERLNTSRGSAPPDQNLSNAPAEISPVGTTTTKAEMQQSAFLADHGLRHSSPLPETTSSASRPGQNEAVARKALHSSSRSSSHSHRITSSQTTEGETYSDGPRIKQEPRSVEDEDVPIVVSSRTVRKPKRSNEFATPTVWYGRQRQGDEKTPVRIKHESSGIEMGVPTFVPPLTRTQTSDLDLVQGDIETPRKRRRIGELTTDMLQHYQKTGSMASYADSESRSGAQGTANLGPQSISRGENDQIRVQASNDQENDDSQRPFSEATLSQNEQASISSTNSRKSNREPLQPVSTNTPTMPRTSAYTPDSKSTTSSRRSRGSTSNKIHAIAEDQDPATSKRKSNRRQNPRLDELLEGHNMPEPRMPISPRPPTTNAPRSSRRAVPELEAERTTPQTAQRARQSKSPILEASVKRPMRRSAAVTRSHDSATKRSRSRSVNPEDEPLRVRPLHRLKLEDFRINPAYAGTDFAYADTLRGRDNRRCMPGCTGPCCIGLNDFVPGASTRASTPSGALSAADKEVLEAYLGPGARSAIRSLSLAQCHAMVHRAREQTTANTYGKHRKQFARPKSPPGIWRTDFPSTQEQMEDREEAMRMEREKIQERWEDALRGGGQWKFRDE